MKTKIVYVLACDKKRYYLEQTLMSVYSLRLHNPQAKVTLVTDKTTLDTCREGLRKDFLGYFDEVVEMDTAGFNSNVERSRYMKTSIRNIIDGDFLYIDCDTIVCESLEEIDLQTEPLALVSDNHTSKREYYDIWLNDKEKKKFFGTTNLEKYYNGGVVYAKDTEETRLFFKRWNEEWIKALRSTGVTRDQPPLYTVIEKYGVKVEELNGIWNCQICGNFMPYFYKAKILHTFTNPNFYSPCLFKDPAICKEIRDRGTLTDHIISLIQSPKEAFAQINILSGSQGRDLGSRNLFFRSVYFRENYPAMLSILGFASKILMGACVVLNKIKKIK